MYLLTSPKAWPNSFGSTELGALGDVTLPSVTKMVFRNKDTVHPDNCCKECDAPSSSGGMVRVPLGVGIFGTGMNAMELQFTLSDQPANVE